MDVSRLWGSEQTDSVPSCRLFLQDSSSDSYQSRVNGSEVHPPPSLWVFMLLFVVYLMTLYLALKTVASNEGVIGE
jgi:hypothetical protein